ncbi:MAG TPA: acetate--CoA ligase, partial [Thermoleophilia bacterium]|nr:acetate--CoA ligase [Thermoleophilia bacterium]
MRQAETTRSCLTLTISCESNRLVLYLSYPGGLVDYQVIRKPKTEDIRPEPHLPNPGASCDGTIWQALEGELNWLPGGFLNKAHECIDRHALGPRAEKTALIWEGKNGELETYTFAHLKRESDKFANILLGLGVEKGDRLFMFMERVPELYIAFFGALKVGAVVGPLFSAFGPDPVRDRLADGGARILLTQPALRRRIAEVLPDLPHIQHVIVANKGSRDAEPLLDHDLSYEDLMSAAPVELEIAKTNMFDLSVMHYTSGTTGKPKGAVHCHQAIIQQHATGKWVLDLHEDDIYWCTADPGWVTGTSYGILAPWSNGVTQVVYEGGFKASAWYEMIEKHKVTVWYTAPTAIRMLMKAGAEIPKRYDLSSLRHILSVGEPLNPEAIMWGLPVFNQPIHDSWWQTETGAILISNYAAMDIRPGSMGKPIPGIQAGILDDHYDPLPAGKAGNLAIRPGWPSMFRTYWNDSEKYNSRFRKGWYITGDQAYCDEDGYFWFLGRTDDVINTTGHLVSPFEVESTLLEHPAVAEAGVIGKPDPIAMEVVKAFVALKDGYEPSDQLRREITGFARK